MSKFNLRAATLSVALIVVGSSAAMADMERPGYKPMPGGVSARPRPIASKPFPGGSVKPFPGGGVKPFPGGGIKPKPIGIKPFPMPPVVVGIKPPPKPFPKPPVIIGIKPVPKPPIIIGIKPTPKPPIIIGIKPTPKPPIIIGIKPPPKPFPKPPIIGIPYPPKPKPPIIIGIKYPKPWPKPKFPCPPIVITPPWVVPPVTYYPVPQVPVAVTVPQEMEAYDLSCRLPENTSAQDLLGVDAVVTRTGANQFRLQGTVYGADESKSQLDVTAVGTMDRDLNFSLTGGDQIYLEAVTEQGLEGYLRGEIELLGRTDNKGLLCTLTVHRY